MVAPANDLLHLVLQHVSGDSVSIYTFSPGVVPTPWRRALWAVRMPRAPHLQQRRRGIEPDPASRGVVPVQLRLQQHLAQHGLHRRAPYVAACAHRQRAALLQPPATPHVDTAAMLPCAALACSASETWATRSAAAAEHARRAWQPARQLACRRTPRLLAWSLLRVATLTRQPLQRGPAASQP